MVKRLFDVVFSSMALFFLSPLMLIVVIGIKISSPGSVFFRSLRCGKGAVPFKIHKFRTMIESNNRGDLITSANDHRVFAFGAMLRATKIDELPQLIDVIWGNMSIVGPRPEDVTIVKKYYSKKDHETLKVRPGLASPGSIYNYTHGEKLLSENASERIYVDILLPKKLALEQVYIRNAGFLYDMRLICRTLYVILAKSLGKKDFLDPPEMLEGD